MWPQETRNIHAKSPCKNHRKMGNSTPCKIVPPENIILKLCIRDNVGEATHQAILVSIGSVGASHQIGEILPLCDFFDCPFRTFFSRSCTLHPYRTAESIFTLYGSNDVFPCKDGPFGAMTVGDIIWRKYAPKPSPSKWA